VDSFRLKRPDEIEKMRVSGKILGACLAQLARSVRAGMTTLDLDREAETFIRDHHCIPGFLGYDGFPNSLCVSINDQVVHGIPGPQVINDGDLVSLDCGLILDGWWADSGLSVGCGEASPEVQRLIDTTRQALDLGIAAARPGNHIGDIGAAVQTFVEANGYSVVRQYVAMGSAGTCMNSRRCPTTGIPERATSSSPGTASRSSRWSTSDVRRRGVLDDDWTVVTADRKAVLLLRAHGCDHRVRPEVLTLRPDPVLADVQ